MTMRAELANKYNFDNVDQLTIDEVEDYYEIREVVNARIHELSGTVPFPLYPSTDMNENNHWKELADIDFSEGASFMSDPELDPKYIPGILEFFASLVRFESKKRTDHIKDPAVYYVMPEMLIDFAENSRVDSGFRLIARMVRHAWDSRNPPLHQALAKLIVDNKGDIGLRITSKIPASMKKKTYQTEVAATSKEIKCCKCTCQSGSQAAERIVCVHTNIKLYDISLFLHQHLAEHILLELAAHIGSDNSSGELANTDDVSADQQWMWELNLWTAEDMSSMKCNVKLLLEAAGEMTELIDLSKSLPEMLEAFLVGTEQRKTWKAKGPPKPSELGPVAGMNFQSTVKQAKAVMNRDVKKRNVSKEDQHIDEEDSTIEEEDSTEDDANEMVSPPQYRKIWSLLEAAGGIDAKCKYVGVRLLNLRATRDDQTLTLTKKSKMDKKS